MRYLFPIAILLIIGLAHADIQTLADMGINPVVGPVDQNKAWEIPYQFGEDCTPFFAVNLISGRIMVYDNNAEVLSTKRPGTYRIILDRNGIITLVLQRLQGEAEARVDPNSFVACDRVPVVEINRLSPEVWKVGGYTTVRIILRNRGTADAEGILLLQNPYNAAPLEPLKKIRIPAKSEINYNITYLTSKEDTKVLFPKLCFEYSDKYGASTACVDSTTFRAEKNVPLTCIQGPEKAEVFNGGYMPTEINGEEILPRDSILLERSGASGAVQCAIELKIQKMPFKEIEDQPVYYSLILTLLGLIGILISEKRLKTSKA